MLLFLVMQQRATNVKTAAVVAFLIAWGTVAHAQAPELPQSQPVQAERQVANPLKRSNDVERGRSATADTTIRANDEPYGKPEENQSRASDRQQISETSEYWVIFDRKLKITDCLLVIFTGLLFASTVLLWWHTRQLVLGADKTAERQLRAYVFLDPENEMTFVSPASTTSTIEIEIHVRNTGLTPAYDVVGESWVALDVWPIPENFNFSGPPSGQPDNRFIIPPNSRIHYHTGTARPMTAQELAAMESGTACIYVYGRISYRDAFDKPRYTNFCYASTTLHKLGYTKTLAMSDRHNDAN